MMCHDSVRGMVRAMVRPTSVEALSSVGAILRFRALDSVDDDELGSCRLLA